MMTTQTHIAHVERDSAIGSYYLWCEDDECEAVFQRYTVAMEAEDAARNHGLVSRSRTGRLLGRSGV